MCYISVLHYFDLLGTVKEVIRQKFSLNKLNKKIKDHLIDRAIPFIIDKKKQKCCHINRSHKKTVAVQKAWTKLVFRCVWNVTVFCFSSSL